MKNIIGLGEILWDMLPSGKVLGGAPSNFAYHVSQFGLNGYAISAIGNDLLGKEILDSLVEKRLNFLIENVDFPTGTVQVTLDEKGVPQYEICEGVAWDNIPFTQQSEELARVCDAICFGSLAQRNVVSRTTILKILELVPATALKIFDINLRQHFYSKEIIENSLKHCNILKINDEEVVIVAKLLYPVIAAKAAIPQTVQEIAGQARNDDFEVEVCKRLLQEYNLKMVILTKGVIGSSVITTNETSYIDTPKVHVADTVGAGDSFTGTFVAALLNSESVRNAHKLAVEVSAYVCTQHGAMPKLPDAFVELYK
ncbi:MAG: carbohydrate kinase [Dysgonamonadaceae bacterium]|jgi:fructokinase|nr:carbohydrate kinase [Dysgonamonadaceae bacterium]